MRSPSTRGASRTPLSPAGRLSPSRITVREPTAAPGLSLSRRKGDNGKWGPATIESSGEREFQGCRYGTGRLAQELDLPTPEVSRSPCQNPAMLPVAIGPRMAEIYRHVGNSSLKMNDVDGAMHFHFEVLKLAIAKGDMLQQGRTYAQLGSALYNKGVRLPQAAIYFERAFEIGVEIGDTVLAGISCGNLAWAHDRLHNVAEALHHHHTARMLTTISGHSGGITCPNCVLAAGYHSLGDRQSLMGCITKFQQQLIECEQRFDPMREACANGNLAAAYYSLGDDDSRSKAMRYHSHAQELMQAERHRIKNRLRVDKSRQCHAIGYTATLPQVPGLTAHKIVSRAPWTPHLDVTALGETLRQVNGIDRDKLEIGHCRRRKEEGAMLASKWLGPSKRQPQAVKIGGSLYHSAAMPLSSSTYPAGPAKCTMSTLTVQDRMMKATSPQSVIKPHTPTPVQKMQTAKEVAVTGSYFGDRAHRPAGGQGQPTSLPTSHIMDENAQMQADRELQAAENATAARLNAAAAKITVGLGLLDDVIEGSNNATIAKGFKDNSKGNALYA